MGVEKRRKKAQGQYSGRPAAPTAQASRVPHGPRARRHRGAPFQFDDVAAFVAAAALFRRG